MNVYCKRFKEEVLIELMALILKGQLDKIKRGLYIAYCVSKPLFCETK